MLPEQSYVAWKVCLALVHAFAVGSTGLRLWDRYQNRRLWWDDYLAVLPMACDILYAALFYYRYKERDLSPEERREASNWTIANSFLYYTIIWASRTSLSLSITRIFAPGHRVRKWLFALTSSFIAAYVVSFVLSVVTCSASAIDWRKLQLDTRTCRKGPQGYYLGGIIATCFDFLADAALVICPLVLLWRIHLSDIIERRMVLAAFSASVLTALAAIVFTIFWYGGLDLGPDKSILIAAVCHIQAGVSLIVCNTLIVVTYFYRRFLRPRDTRPSLAISTFLDESCSTHISISDRRHRRGHDPQNNRPYNTAPPRLVQSPDSGGVSYDLPDRLTLISDCATSRHWHRDGESNYAESMYDKYGNFDDVPSWIARGAEQLSVTSTFESAARRFEAKKVKEAAKAQRREGLIRRPGSKSPGPGKKPPGGPPS